MSEKKKPDEVFERLEKEYAGTRIITVIQRGQDSPKVQWDDSLTESEVIGNLFKALLFMTLDDYIMECFDEMSGEDDYDDQDDDT